MNRLLTNVPVLFATLALAGCAASGPAAPSATTAAPDTTRPATTAGRATQPAEDLSKYRPKFSPPPAPKPLTGKTFVTPTASVNALIDQRLRDQAYTNQNVKYTSGYRIQAYVGLERDEAMAIRRAVISRYPEETDYVVFKQPIYRLFIGDYPTRLDAERAMLRIRPLAPKAELQPAQVLINKTRF
ncbi:sporulation protein [Hymenobacter sp. 15J16-1T3B]|uniref:sporulation protein n=1 Tax=Hymenobacter sp. 15J16-1T3B TaxID=2886941 RepID=UPI001D0F76A3|nr:sporulation protein [Hymenobacter sp. 15J16-1T3B]MCC3157685.1 sporulation protein [Hymenobacter sp. 15J16-1T3B]